MDPGVFEFGKDHLPEGDWKEYRKTTTTKMIRIDRPFAVRTREGFITCQDGFLAIDSSGWPYPIAADEQSRIYELVA